MENLLRLYHCTVKKVTGTFGMAGIKVYMPDGRGTDDWLEALGYAEGPPQIVKVANFN
jgi:hypothetical protein